MAVYWRANVRTTLDGESSVGAFQPGRLVEVWILLESQLGS